MANTFKFGNGEWAVGKETVLAYNDENNNFKPLPFSFDRASTATVVNKDGLIETVGADEPRIDFLNNTKGHLLLEPSRRNDFTYSELSQGTSTGGFAYKSTTATVTANDIASPSGAVTGAKLTTTTANNIFDFYKLYTTQSDNLTYSMFVKKGSIGIIQLSIIGSGVSSDTAVTFNLDDESYGNLGGDVISAFITNYGNGWYKVGITSSNSPIGSPIQRIRFPNAGYMYMWGIQLEAGSYATSYIPTSGSAVTRSAETCSQTNATKVIGQSEGTMYIEFVPKDTSALQILYQVRSSSGTIGQVDIRLQSGLIRGLANDGGSSQFFINGGSYTAGTTYKVALRYKLNDSKLYINGSSVGSDTSCSFTGSSLDQISFAENLTSLVPIADILDARLYNTALSDSELQALTS